MVSNLARGVQAFTSNAYLVPGERTVLVDAGANFDVVERIEERAGGLDAVLLTHTHPDHVGNLDAVRAAFDIDAWGFDPDRDGVDRAVEDGETVRVGDHRYVALHTPGHAPDHLCFYSRAARTLFAGDLVFQNGSFGRTDLQGGDRATLVESIERLLAEVDEDLDAMHAGHGPSVTNRPYDDIELAARAARME